MKKTITTLLTCILGVTGFSQNICQNDTFVQLEDSPIGFRDAVVYDDVIYGIGENAVYKYEDSEWTEHANSGSPTNRGEMGVAQVDGVIYCIGGWAWTGSPNNINESYDIVSKTWQTNSSAPGNIGSCNATSLNGDVYVFGGVQGASGITESRFYKYNPENDSYTVLNTPSQDRRHSELLAYNNKIYLVGGYYNSPSGQYRNELDVYDPQTDSWSSLANLPISLSTSSAVVYNDQIYLFGGTNTGRPVNGGMKSVYAYDFATDSWSRLDDMPAKKKSSSAVTKLGSIFIIGGSNDDTNTEDSKSVYQYYCEDLVCLETIYDTSYVTVYDTVAVTDTLIMDVDITTGSNEMVSNQMKVYPNPASDIITIDNGNYSSMSDHYVRIVNALGQEVFNEVITGQQFQIEVNDLGAEGTYYIQIWSPNSEMIETKVLVLE